jgi:hypothetical protein
MESIVEEGVFTRLAAKRPKPTALTAVPDRVGAPRVSTGGKSNLVPVLWPDKARKHGMGVILRGTAEFIKRRGWHPNTQELASFLLTTSYAVQWFADENRIAGLMERYGDRTGGNKALNREHRLTARGWAAVGMEPIGPRRRRPSKLMRDRIAAKVVSDVVKALKA